MALEIVYRTENRCKSSGAPAGAFPKPPLGPGWDGTRLNIDDFRSYPPPRKKHKTPFDGIGVCLQTMSPRRGLRSDGGVPLREYQTSSCSILLPLFRDLFGAGFGSAELKGPRTLLIIRPEFFDFESDLRLKLSVVAVSKG